MNRFLLLAAVLVLALPGPTFAAIVYTGSQPVTLTLDGGMSPPREMAMIGIAGSPDDWDDFRVDLWWDDTMSMSHLAISAPMGVQGMAMGGIMGTMAMTGDFAFNLKFGDMIPGLNPSFLGSAHLYDAGVGQFDEEGGYMGLMIDMPSGSTHYAYMRMLSQSNLGEDDHSVTFDAWAYEGEADKPIAAGAIPAPAAIVLGGLGIGLVTWLRRRRVV